MIDILAIASTLIVVAIFLYLRFGIRRYLRKFVHSEFRAMLRETQLLKEDDTREKDSDCSESK